MPVAVQDLKVVLHRASVEQVQFLLDLVRVPMPKIERTAGDKAGLWAALRNLPILQLNKTHVSDGVGFFHEACLRLQVS